MSPLPRAPRRWSSVAVVVLAVSAAGCGDDADDDAGADTEAVDAESESDSGGDSADTGDTVPLSTLGLPFELSYDPPVPADAEVAEAIENEAGGQTLVRYQIRLDTSATFEDVADAYDEYVATMPFGGAFEDPDPQGWFAFLDDSGASQLRVYFGGGRLNIEEFFPAE